MRVINTFLFNHTQEFKVGELTVGQYYLFLSDPESALEQVLSEFNQEIPTLTKSQLARFLDILFSHDNPSKKLMGSLHTSEHQKTLEHLELDFHISYVTVCKQIHADCCDMPFRIFNRILKDIAILSGSQTYDPQRHSANVDKHAVRQVMGGNAVLHSTMH